MVFSAEEWHKANFDGTTKGNPGPTGCGGIIRNCHGFGVAAFSYPLGTQMNHYTEASVVLQAIKLALAIGIKKFRLEGDSLNIIKCLKGCSHPS